MIRRLKINLLQKPDFFKITGLILFLLFGEKAISQIVTSAPESNVVLNTDTNEQESPIICKSGVYIKTIRIHEADELFETQFYFWLRVDSIDPTIDYSGIKGIEFVNANAEMEIDYDSLDITTGTYLLVGRCKAEIPYKADYSQFPFDVQTLSFCIENTMENSQNLVFVPDNISPPINLIKDNNIDILNGGQFSITKLSVMNKLYTYKTNFGDPTVEANEKYSRMEFLINIDRDPLGIMQKIVLPLLVVLILSYLVFYIPDYEIGTASALTVTALLAAIAFQWTLNDSLPKVSYLTMVDKIFYLVYLFIFYAMLQTVYTFNLNKRGESLAEVDVIKSKKLMKLSEDIEWHSRYLFPLLFLLLLMIIIYF